MSYLKLSLVIVLLVCGYGLGRPNEADKEERLDMNDPDVQEAIEAAVNELSKHSDARFRRLRAWAVKKVVRIIEIINEINDDIFKTDIFIIIM